jgi:hypothetical protein
MTRKGREHSRDGWYYFWGGRMVRPQYDPQKLRSLARRCREKAKTAIEPADIAQFKIWATELADKADEIERRSETISGFWSHARRGRVTRTGGHKGSPFWPKRH